MSTTNYNNFEMFWSPYCLVNTHPSAKNNPPNLCFSSKNTNPLHIIPPITIRCQRIPTVSLKTMKGNRTSMGAGTGQHRRQRSPTFHKLYRRPFAFHFL